MLFRSLGEEDNPTIIWSNAYINKKLEETEDLKLLDVDDIYLSLRNMKLGSLIITGKGTNFTVFCQLSLNSKEETEIIQKGNQTKKLMKFV